MRRYIPLFIVLFLLAGVAYFLITARLVGRHLLRSLPEPAAFAGPDLVGGYVLARGLRGPESFIEDPSGAVVLPPPGEDLARVGVVRIGVRDRFITGELADLADGGSRGFFLIDTSSGAVRTARSEDEWREMVRAALHAEPPELVPADSFAEPGDAP